MSIACVEGWPNIAIPVIVPYSAGGVADIVPRIVFQYK
jgi:tripartite-type tricarboxylate transporter receptor subunit TctC